MNLHKFRTFCNNEGAHLLSDDTRFIGEQLNRLSKTAQKRYISILNRYFREWLQGAEEEKNPILAQSCGRNKANQWLTAYIDGQLQKSARKLRHPPPKK